MRFSRILLLPGLFAGGVLLGIQIERHGSTPPGIPAEPAQQQHLHEPVQAQAQYVCPMHPEVVSPSPDTCPVCGMELVRREPAPAPAAASGAFPEIRVPPGFVHNFGVRTAAVERGTVARYIEAIGRVSRMPQPRLTEVTPGLTGKLVELTGKEIGAQVHQGERLYALDAPEWRQLQQHYQEAVAEADDNRSTQLQQRLQSLGMSPARLGQLRAGGEIEQTLAVYAPVAGTLVERMPAAGETVTAQSRVVTLGGINRVPVIVSAFEGQGAWIDRGQQVRIRVPTLPGTEFIGTVDRTDREINFSTRTLPVYVGFNTADPRIRYGMLVDVAIEAAERRGVLRIPREALIRTGTGERVILDRGAGRFQPVEVVPGLENDDYVEILSGLEEGQLVVVSGQFLIDSESSLRTSLQRMDEGVDAP